METELKVISIIISLAALAISLLSWYYNRKISENNIRIVKARNFWDMHNKMQNLKKETNLSLSDKKLMNEETDGKLKKYYAILYDKSALEEQEYMDIFAHQFLNNNIDQELFLSFYSEWIRQTYIIHKAFYPKNSKYKYQIQLVEQLISEGKMVVHKEEIELFTSKANR